MDTSQPQAEKRRPSRQARRVLVAVRRRRNTPDTIPPQGVNSKTVQWTVFEEGTPWERGRPLAVFLNELFFLPQGRNGARQRCAPALGSSRGSLRYAPLCTHTEHLLLAVVTLLTGAAACRPLKRLAGLGRGCPVDTSQPQAEKRRPSRQARRASGRRPQTAKYSGHNPSARGEFKNSPVDCF